MSEPSSKLRELEKNLLAAVGTPKFDAIHTEYSALLPEIAPDFRETLQVHARLYRAVHKASQEGALPKGMSPQIAAAKAKEAILDHNKQISEKKNALHVLEQHAPILSGLQHHAPLVRELTRDIEGQVLRRNNLTLAQVLHRK